MVIIHRAHLCRNAAGIGDSTSQGTESRTVVVHVDFPVFKILSPTTLELSETIKIGSNQMGKVGEKASGREQGF